MSDIAPDIKAKLQAAFDKVWDWFVVQGKPKSVNAQRECLYRGRNGCRCALGVLIPDDEYNPMIENSSPYSFMSTGECRDIAPKTVVDFIKATGGDKGIGVRFLSRLQETHDDAIPDDAASFTELVAENLRAFAGSYQLSLPAAA
jgi:hypothetical protein